MSGTERITDIDLNILEQMDETLRELEETNKQLMKEKTSLELTVSAQKKQIADEQSKSSSVNALESEIQRLQNEKEVLQNDKESLEKNLEEKCNEIQNLSRKCTTTEKNSNFKLFGKSFSVPTKALICLIFVFFAFSLIFLHSSIKNAHLGQIRAEKITELQNQTWVCATFDITLYDENLNEVGVMPEYSVFADGGNGDSTHEKIFYKGNEYLIDFSDYLRCGLEI